MHTYMFAHAVELSHSKNTYHERVSLPPYISFTSKHLTLIRMSQLRPKLLQRRAHLIRINTALQNRKRLRVLIHLLHCVIKVLLGFDLGCEESVPLVVVVVRVETAAAVLQVLVFRSLIPHGFDQRDVVPVADFVVWAFVDGVLLQPVSLFPVCAYVRMDG